MRCYNRQCEKWKKTEGGCDCVNRVGTKQRAVSEGVWDDLSMFVQIGNSVGVVIPARIRNASKIKKGERCKITLVSDGILISPPDVKK